MPNEYTANLSLSIRATRCEVIGTPKTDTFISMPMRDNLDDPVIGIAFHWGGKNAIPPESGNAWEYYRDMLPALAKRYKMIGHGHPLSIDEFKPAFESAGIEWVSDFREVVRRADIFINDLSSVMYEFMTTGKPVIVLNAPWFRRSVNWGIRFWDYSDVGINVEKPADLFPAIDRTLANYRDICSAERIRAAADLYPYLGRAAERAVGVLLDYLDELEEGLGL